jgi:succinyl-diaminopimelate desuccinylase
VRAIQLAGAPFAGRIRLLVPVDEEGLMLGVKALVARAPLNGDASQINCLPDQCDAFLDIRSLPSMHHGTLIADIRALMDGVRAQNPGYRFDLEVIDDRPATEIAVDHPLVQAVTGAHQQTYGAAPAYGGVPGSTDGTILARDRGIPVVVYGPGDKHIPHQPDEFVAVEEVVRAAQVYIIAALRFLNRGAG